jgi:hypothetical protein
MLAYGDHPCRRAQVTSLSMVIDKTFRAPGFSVISCGWKKTGNPATLQSFLSGRWGGGDKFLLSASWATLLAGPRLFISYWDGNTGKIWDWPKVTFQTTKCSDSEPGFLVIILWRRQVAFPSKIYSRSLWRTDCQNVHKSTYLFYRIPGGMQC